MDPTRELIDLKSFGAAAAVLSGLGFAVAMVSLAAFRRRAIGIRCGILGGAAALVYPLWLGYNRIVDQFGLDSVVGLGVNLLAFVLIGALAGGVIRRVWPREAA